MQNKFSTNIELTVKDFKFQDGKIYIKNPSHKKGFVVIYAPWCGYCQMLAPEWKKFAKQYKDKYLIKALNADNEKVIVQKLEVQGYPTIKYIDENGKIESTYEGERNIKSFDNYLSQK